MNNIIGDKIQLVFPKNRDLLQKLFEEILENYQTLPEKLSQSLWSAFSQADRSLLLAFMEKNELFHKAVQSKNEKLILFFHQLGMNINGIDSEGNTPLQYALIEDPDLSIWLFSQGARYPEEKGGNRALLEGVLGQKNKGYEKLLSEIIKLCTFQQLTQLNDKGLRYVFIKIEDLETKKLVLCRLKEALASSLHRAMALQCVKKILRAGYFSRKKTVFIWFLSLLQQKALTCLNAEEILSDAKLFYGYSELFPLLLDAQYGWEPSEKLKELIDSLENDFIFAFKILVLLSSTSLPEAIDSLFLVAKFSSGYSEVTQKLQGVLSQRIVAHIELLQKREQRSFWQALARRVNPVDREELYFFVRLGFDPNWSDPKNEQHLLFTKFAEKIGDEKSPCQITIDLYKCNKRGDNALEHHCRVKVSDGNNCRRQLVRAGLRLSENFPFREKCQQLFPENPFLQAEMAHLLLYPNRNALDVKHLEKSDRDAIERAILNDKEVFTALKEYYGNEAVSNEVYDKSKEWQQLLEDSEGQNLLKSRCEKKSLQVPYAIALCSHFLGNKISTSSLKVIPDSPIASLAVLTLQVQHEKVRIPLSYYLSPCKRRGVVHWVRHLFENPSLMKIFVTDYLQLKSLEIAPRGGLETTFATSIHTVCTALKKLRHWPQDPVYLVGEAKTHYNKIQNAFIKKIVPQPVDKLILLGSGATMSLAGRTVFVTTPGEDLEAFKFLKQKSHRNSREESYEDFSRELSITQVFKEQQAQFQSRFHVPQGLYLLKELPEQFPKDEAIGAAPYFVYHYRSTPELCRYPQELSAELFAACRPIWLSDEALMVYKGYTLEPAALFHNSSQQRGYSLFIDWAAQIASSLSTSSIPHWGAGRLDKPFSMVRFPNRRQSGVTDLGDGHLIYSRGANDIEDLRGMRDMSRADIRLFHQMNSLANILLIDLLLVVEREKSAGRLNWQNPESLASLKEQLLVGYALVMAGYSGEALEKCRNFTEHSGIDWQRMALQVAFWCDNSAEGYPSWVARGELPPGLYEASAKISVDVADAKNFDPIKGFQTDGEQDIGPYNGPLCLVEFERAVYTLFVAVILREPTEKKVRSIEPFLISLCYSNLFLLSILLNKKYSNRYFE